MDWLGEKGRDVGVVEVDWADWKVVMWEEVEDGFVDAVWVRRCRLELADGRRPLVNWK